MRISKDKWATTATVAVALVLSGAGVVGAQTLNDTAAANDAGTTSTSGSGALMTATSTATGTPGIPNTGAGGDAAANLTAIIVSAIAAVGGTYYLRKRSAVR